MTQHHANRILGKSQWIALVSGAAALITVVGIQVYMQISPPAVKNCGVKGVSCLH